LEVGLGVERGLEVDVGDGVRVEVGVGEAFGTTVWFAIKNGEETQIPEKEYSVWEAFFVQSSYRNW
jgi:hypothetical protein